MYPVSSTTNTNSVSNSASLCLEIPHGNIAVSDSASIQATAIVLIFFSPSDIALTTATSSAQTEAGYDAFSMLHPEYTFPESVIKAAPTLKFEYGAYA